MKRLFFIILSAAFAGQDLQAQTCTCNTNGWQPGTAMINNFSKAIKCGDQLSLHCGDSITISEEYKCSGACSANYSAVLKDASGAVISTYGLFSFPWTHQFKTGGDYSLDITPLCGNNHSSNNAGNYRCTPCHFSFKVTCLTLTKVSVSCDEFESTIISKPFIATIGDGYYLSVSSGHHFMYGNIMNFRIKGTYKCKGSCTVKYIAILSQGYLDIDVKTFTSASDYSYSFVPGEYKLKITPICGKKNLTPSVFSFSGYVE